MNQENMTPEQLKDHYLQFCKTTFSKMEDDILMELKRMIKKEIKKRIKK